MCTQNNAFPMETEVNVYANHHSEGENHDNETEINNDMEVDINEVNQMKYLLVYKSFMFTL